MHFHSSCLLHLYKSIHTLLNWRDTKMGGITHMQILFFSRGEQEVVY